MPVPASFDVPALESGAYQLVVGLYKIEDGKRLTVTLDEEPVGDSLPLEKITLK